MENQSETAPLDVLTPISMDGQTLKIFSTVIQVNGSMQITTDLEMNTQGFKVTHVEM
jgi:hypothetical protein